MKQFFDFFDNFDWHSVAVDKSHTMLLYGVILSHKPKTILEIGIGSGVVTKTIQYAINYNQMGKLTSVDSWHDWQGKEPDHIPQLREMGVNIISPIPEQEFVNSCNEKFDIIVVDGDHQRGGLWADKVLSLLNGGGFLFAHDVDLPQYKTLKNYITLSNQNNYFNHTFKENSREDEWCHRGWLMINKTI